MLKWDRIQQAMRKINADGCLLTVDVNLYYTTGRIYSGYFYLPAEGAAVLRETAERPAGDHVELHSQTGTDGRALRVLRTEMPEKFLLEADELTYNDYIRLQKILQSERDRKRNRNDA